MTAAAVDSDLSVHGPPKLVFYLPESVLDYCSEILAGLDNYLCRHKDCRAYMPNSQWVKQLEFEKFRCPLCTREFSPGRKAQTACWSTRCW
jgi:hypothetical protein